MVLYLNAQNKVLKFSRVLKKERVIK